MKALKLVCSLFVLMMIVFALPAFAQDTEAEITAALHKWADTYEARDIAAQMATYSQHHEVVLYGTGADEKRVGLDAVKMQVERDWAQSEASSMELSWTHVGYHGDIAWTANDCAFHATLEGTEYVLPGRLTTVMVFEDNAWKMVQAHVSFPYGEQAEGESFPDKE